MFIGRSKEERIWDGGASDEFQISTAEEWEHPAFFQNSRGSSGQVGPAVPTLDSSGFVLRMKQLGLHFRKNPLATVAESLRRGSFYVWSLNRGSGKGRSGRCRGKGVCTRQRA